MSILCCQKAFKIALCNAMSLMAPEGILKGKIKGPTYISNLETNGLAFKWPREDPLLAFLLATRMLK